MPTDQAEQTRRHHQQDAASREGIAAWAKLNGLTERTAGNPWCGHNLLGQRPNRSHNRPKGPTSRWWDHVRQFGVGRQQVVLLGFPYSSRHIVEAAVSTYATTLGLPWKVGHADGPLSLYFWGSATPWIIAAPGTDVESLFAATSPDIDQAQATLREYAAWRDGRAT